MQDQWVRFAETGDPGDKELSWPAYEPENRWTMLLSDQSRIIRDPLSEQRALLDPILDQGMNASYALMDFNVPFVWKMAGKTLGILLFIAFVLFVIFRV